MPCGAVAGVQSEIEFAFAGLHQLCLPLLDRLERLPAPQREALATAFGLRAGTPPDRFFVGLAVLTLVSEAAEERPLVCLVDDAQWLDRASAQVLALVARRLASESVALIFAMRGYREHGEFAGLLELGVEGLGDRDARALLNSVVVGPIDERIRDRIVAETRGNPLALLELPRDLTAAELAGGFGFPDATALEGRIEDSFRRRLDALPADTRRLLLLAAAEPIGDAVLLWRAAARLGVGPEAAAPAEAKRLLALGTRVWFRHPLVRSAVYSAGVARGPPKCAPRSGRGHRCGDGARSPGVASRRGCDRTRRQRRRGARALRRARASARRACRRGRDPAARCGA